MRKNTWLVVLVTAAGLLGLSSCGGGGGGGDPGNGPIPTMPPPGPFSIDPARELRRIGAATKIALDFASLFSPLTPERLANLAAAGGVIPCPGSGGGANTLTVGNPAAGRYTLDFNQCDTSWAVVDGDVEVGPSQNVGRLNHDFDLVWDGLQFTGSISVEHAEDRFDIVSGGTSLTVQQSGATFRLVPGVTLFDQGDGTYRFDPDAGFTRGPLGTDGGVTISRGFGTTDVPAFVTIENLGGAFSRVNPPYQGDLDYDRLTAGSAHLVEGNVELTGATFGARFRIDMQGQFSSTTQGQWSQVLANPLFTIDD